MCVCVRGREKRYTCIARDTGMSGISARYRLQAHNTSALTVFPSSTPRRPWPRRMNPNWDSNRFILHGLTPTGPRPPVMVEDVHAYKQLRPANNWRSSSASVPGRTCILTALAMILHQMDAARMLCELFITKVTASVPSGIILNLPIMPTSLF